MASITFLSVGIQLDNEITHIQSDKGDCAIKDPLKDSLGIKLALDTALKNWFYVEYLWF